MVDFFEMVKLGIQIGIGFYIGHEGTKKLIKGIKLCFEDFSDWFIGKYAPEIGDDDECN